MGLLKLVGIVGILVGVIFIAAGVYGLAGGTAIRFTINDRVVSPEEGGQIFSGIGIVILLVGAGLTYFSRKKG